MTTITLDNPSIENKYSDYEIKMKFLSFLENDLKEDNVNLYEIAVDNLSVKSQEKLKNIDSLNFIDY